MSNVSKEPRGSFFISTNQDQPQGIFERGKIYSLKDMVTLKLAPVFKCGEAIENMLREMKNTDHPTRKKFRNIDAPLTQVWKTANALGLTESAKLADGTVKDMIVLRATPQNEQVIIDGLIALQKVFWNEVDSVAAFAISRYDQYLYESPEPFGGEVHARFPSITNDVRASTQCLVLDQYPASVFHAMKATEIGLQFLAGKFKIGLATQSSKSAYTRDKDWQPLIDEIRKAIGSLPDDTPKQRSKKSDFGRIIDHLFNVKDERARVSHARLMRSENYTRKRAEYIFDEVRLLFTQLSNIYPQKSKKEIKEEVGTPTTDLPF